MCTYIYIYIYYILHIYIYIYIYISSSIKDIEKKLCENDAKRSKRYNRKCKNVLIN